MTKAKSKIVSAASAAPKTKKQQVLGLLRREGGASLNEIVQASGWQPHSARAILTGFRKEGIEKSKVDGVTRYNAAAEPVA